MNDRNVSPYLRAPIRTIEQAAHDTARRGVCLDRLDDCACVPLLLTDPIDLELPRPSNGAAYAIAALCGVIALAVVAARNWFAS
jgi:hypothetical protein